MKAYKLLLALTAAGLTQNVHAGPYYYINHGHMVIPGEMVFMSCQIIPNFGEYSYLQIAERYDQLLNACVWAMPDWPNYWEQTDAVNISFPDITPPQNLHLGATYYAYWSCPGTYETHQLGGSRRRLSQTVEPFAFISTDTFNTFQCGGGGW